MIRVPFRQPAEEVDPPADRGQLQRLLLGFVRRGGDEDHVCTSPTWSLRRLPFPDLPPED